MFVMMTVMMMNMMIVIDDNGGAVIGLEKVCFQQFFEGRSVCN